MISARLKLQLGDGVVVGQSSNMSKEGEMSNHNHTGSQLGSEGEDDTTQQKHGLTATDLGIIDDHNMQELEWEEGWYENGKLKIK